MHSGRRSRWLLVVALVAAASPAAADQWYEHYANAEHALVQGDHETAIAELNAALERRGDSGARVRTYGMRVVDYFPYLKLGIAYFAAGEYEAALRAFETEEQLGAIRESESASGELTRFRRRANEALERQRTERRQEIDRLVGSNLAEARRLQAAGKLDDALAAVDRALALSPNHGDAVALAASLREAVAEREDERQRTERADRLVAEGRRLRSDGRLVDAAARFRQAAELVPGGAADALLGEVQAELARAAEAAPAPDSGATLDRAEQLFGEGEHETALGLVQQVLADRPGDARAADLESRLLARLDEQRRASEVAGLVQSAESRLDTGDIEGAIAAANLVLARDRGNARALAVIRRGYGALSRRLLGEGPTQNLPPAIRFADLRRPAGDGPPVQIVRDRQFVLTGVVIDESRVTVEAVADTGTTFPVELAEQMMGGVAITEFRVETTLPPGPAALSVVAVDDEGLTSRSDYLVEYRPPLLRSPWLWGGGLALVVAAAGARLIRRAVRRRQLRRRRFNPYIAGPPVIDPTLFVGRDALIDRVLATVPNNSLLLLGERRIGKTSILHQLRSRLPDFDHPKFCFLPVPVDLQGVPEEAFFATVAEAIGEAVGDDRMAAARAADGYDSRELVRDLRRVLPTIDCPDDRRAKLVLLLDEIDELNGYSHRTNQRLRSLFMRSFADQLVAVAAGVGIAREWNHEGSPWYNFFEELRVGPLDPEAAKRLVVEPLGGVLAIDAAALARLLEIAGGRPYLLQKTALAAVQLVHEEARSRITVEDVEAVL